MTNHLSKFALALTSVTLLAAQTFAKAEGEHKVAVAQGVSSPSETSLINFTSGWTAENPAGAIYQKSVRLSAQGHSNGSDGFGGEFGVGGQSWGLAAGYYDPCDGCDGRTALAGGYNFGPLALGLRIEEEFYTLGFIVGPNSQHRIGVTAGLLDPDGEDNNITSLGFGYSFVHHKFTLSLEASQNNYENDLLTDDRILFSPGLMLRLDPVQISINYQALLNDENDQNTTDEDGDFWFGVGFGQNSWHLALYSDYVGDISGSLSFYF